MRSATISNHFRRNPWARTGALILGATLLIGFGLVRFASGLRYDASKMDATEPGGPPMSSANSGGGGGTAPPVPAVDGLRTNAPRSNFESRSSDAMGFAPAPETEFHRFSDWTRTYLSATDPAVQSRLESEGVRLAARRRGKLMDLIETDPRRALELAVPAGLPERMPVSVRSLLETRFSAKGDLEVLAALAQPGDDAEVKPIYRTITIDGRALSAYVFGRRLGEPTMFGIPLHGIALEDRAAIAENPTRALYAAEIDALPKALWSATCRWCKEAPANVAAMVFLHEGSEVAPFCCPDHADQFDARLIEAETDTIQRALASPAGTSRTLGTKTMILIRVDFSDLPGDPFDAETATNLVRNVHGFYRASSYGRTGFRLLGEGSDLTPTLRVPQTAAFYGSNGANSLRRDARAAATEAGYRLGDYDFDLICFGRVPGFSWAGLGFVGAAGAWIHNTSSTRVVAHELGHNFGLSHANFWDTTGRSVIGSGTSVEYGDNFDNMGSANATAGHFNARYKSYLNWLPASAVTRATTNGTYRLFAHDMTNDTGVRGLSIVKNSATNYWLELRQLFTNRTLVSGVGVRWAGNGNQSTRMLDTSPGTPEGKNDSALAIGRTFSDLESGIHVTPIAKNGSVPESIDLVVYRGSFPENQPPSIALIPTQTNGATGTTFAFSAAATDPNGDALAYYWDFGDGTFGENTPTATKRWTTMGNYVVRCSVTDMKGGIASDSTLVRVGAPTTFTLAGRVLRNGTPLEGVRVFVSNTRVAFTDSQGRYVLTGLTSGSYTLKASREGFIFSHPTFSNPIALTQSRAGANFDAALPTDLDTVILIAAGAEWKYWDTGENLGTAWRELGTDDRLWKSGPAQLGYGDDDVITEVGFGTNAANKFVTTYFRHTFVIDELKPFAALTVGMVRDDGGVVYLNGREIFRSNMPTGTVNYRTLASSTTGGADESTFFENDVDPALLRSGTNVVAVELHQSNANSSDLSFNLQLTGIATLRAPTLELAWAWSADGLVLSWSQGLADAVLQSAGELGSGAPWRAVDLPAVVGDGRVSVTVPPGAGNGFYRLVRP